MCPKYLLLIVLLPALLLTALQVFHGRLHLPQYEPANNSSFMFIGTPATFVTTD